MEQKDEGTTKQKVAKRKGHIHISRDDSYRKRTPKNNQRHSILQGKSVKIRFQLAEVDEKTFKWDRQKKALSPTTSKNYRDITHTIEYTETNNGKRKGQRIGY